MDQLVRGSSASLRYSFLDGETPVALASVTFGVVNDIGTVIVAPGTTAVLLPDAPEGTAQAALTAAQLSEVGLLTVTWTGVTASAVQVVRTQQVEVVGAFYFELSELRAMPDITNETELYPTAKLIRARQWVEARIEGVCPTSFVERFRSETRPLDAWRCGKLYTTDEWPRRVLSIALDSTPLTVDQFGTVQPVGGPGGYIGPKTATTGFPWDGQWSTSTVRYVAGYSTTPPEDLRSAALAAARNRLLTVDGHSGIPDRARSMSSGDVTYGLQMADSDHPTGWHDIDAVIVDWRDRVSLPIGVG